MQLQQTTVIENTRTRIGQKGTAREGGCGWVEDGHVSETGGILLDSEVILVFPAAALGYPKYYRGEHQPDVLGDVAVAVVLVHLGVVVQDVLEDQDALVGGRGGKGTR